MTVQITYFFMSSLRFMVVRIYSWRPRKRDASSANNLQFEKKASENTFKTKSTARIDP